MLAETQITTTTPDYVNKIQNLSVVSPEFAIRRPLAELVENALTAAAGESENTARAYLTGIGLFLQYLSDRLGDVLPAEFLPLAEPGKVGRKTVWEFRGEAGVLRAVFAGLMDEVAIFDAALSEEEIQDVMNNGLGADVLAVSHSGKLATAWGRIKND